MPAVDRQTVVIGTTGAPDTLNPLFLDSDTSAAVTYALFTPDVHRDDKWRAYPLGVEYLPSLSDGTWWVAGGRMAVRWKIKSRRWHDGRPVTCADYVFTHRVAQDQRVPVDLDVRAFTNRVTNVSCPRGAEGREVVVTWNELGAGGGLSVLGFNRFIIPRHVLEPFYRSNPSRLHLTPYGSETRVTIGDGPFRLSEWRRGVSLTVEAVQDHPIFGTPGVHRIVWRFFSSAQDLEAAQRSGQIDVSPLTQDQAAALERQAGTPLRVYTAVNGLLEHIDFNFDNPILRDDRVRRAIAHGINRTQIVQQFYDGRPPVAHGYYPPQHPGFAGTVARYAYDPARARALLREAGFAEGPGGLMQSRSGAPLSLELVTTGVSPRSEQARLIQEQLRQIGVELVVLSAPSRVLFQETLPRRRFTGMAMYAFVVGPEAGGCRPRYRSTSIPAETNGWAGGNWTGYRSAEMDAACDAAYTELDEAARTNAFRQVSRIFSRDLPALPLFWRLTLFGAKRSLRNFSIGAPFNGQEMWNAPRWYWE